MTTLYATSLLNAVVRVLNAVFGIRIVHLFNMIFLFFGCPCVFCIRIVYVDFLYIYILFFTLDSLIWTCFIFLWFGLFIVYQNFTWTARYVLVDETQPKFALQSENGNESNLRSLDPIFGPEFSNIIEAHRSFLGVVDMFERDGVVLLGENVQVSGGVHVSWGICIFKRSRHQI